MVLLTLTLRKIDIIKYDNFNFSLFFNKLLSQFKNTFGIFDFYFIYKNHKIFFDGFQRQYPLEYEAHWYMFNQSYLILYAVTTQDHLDLRQSQRFYPINSTLAPTFFLPFNWRTLGLVYTNNTHTPTLFPDNNYYNVFSNVSDILSFIIERGETTPYQNPEFVYLDGQLSNKSFGVSGSQVTVTLPFILNNPAFQTDARYRSFNLMLIFTDTNITNMRITQQADSIDFFPLNNEGIDQPTPTQVLSYYVALNINYSPLNTLTIDFASPGAKIYRCFVSKTPVLGNSPLHVSRDFLGSYSFLSDLIPHDELTQGEYFDGNNYVKDVSKFCYTQRKSRLNTIVTPFYSKLPWLPNGINDVQRFYEVWGRDLFSSPWQQNTFQGIDTVYNFNVEDINDNNYVAVPAQAPLCFVTSTWGKSFNFMTFLMDGQISHFPPILDAYDNYDKFISTTELQMTMTTSDYDWVTLSNSTDTMLDTNTINNFLPVWSLRRNAGPFLPFFTASSDDAFTHGMRSDIVDMTHVVNMRNPSLLTLSFSFSVNIATPSSQLNFRLGGIPNELINSLSCVKAHLSILPEFDVIEPAAAPVQVLCGTIETNLIDRSNLNQSILEPLSFFNGIKSTSSWRKTGYLSNTQTYFLKLNFDDGGNPDHKINVNIQIIFC
jgi:hypothetical protein